MAAINETLKLLPPEAIREVNDFAEFLVQKYLKKKQNAISPKEKILNFAGAWENMKEEDFQNFINDIYKRREKSFTRRRNIE